MPITIKVRQNGPLLIAGDDVAQVALVDHEGNPISTEGRKSIALCRCGASATKPFCDGMHTKIGFQAGEQARAEFDAAKGVAGSGTGGATPAP